ncbi:MAG: ribosome maturation factor RimM [Thermoleophilia bacterium]
MPDNPEWIIVGRVRRPHGAGGEMVVETLTDHDERFAPGAELQVDPEGEGESPPFVVVASRPADKGIIVRVAGVDSREEAKGLIGAGLFIPFSRLAPAAEGSYYSHQVEGCRVYQDDTLVGEVAALRESRANPYLEVVLADGQKPVLIPFVRDAILGIDIEGRRIEINKGFITVASDAD